MRPASACVHQLAVPDIGGCVAGPTDRSAGKIPRLPKRRKAVQWESSTDKVAIVTGSARGIGRATAELLSEQGAKVLINDLDADVAEQTAA